MQTASAPDNLSYDTADLPPLTAGGVSVVSRRRRGRPPLAEAGAGAEDAPAARLTLPLTAVGGLDWERMRAKTRDQLAALVSTADAQARLGTPGGAPQAVPVFDAALVGVMFDSLGALNMAFAKRAGYPAPVAAVLAFDLDEKAVLAGPTEKVLNKYCAGLGPYQDEIALALALSTVITRKIMLLQQAMALYAQQSREGMAA